MPQNAPHTAYKHLPTNLQKVKHGASFGFCIIFIFGKYCLKPVRSQLGRKVYLLTSYGPMGPHLAQESPHAFSDLYFL